MSDVVFVYYSLTSIIDTAIRFPPQTLAPVSGDSILEVDNASFILLIDNATTIQLGH